MKVKLLADFDSNINKYAYKKGQIVDVSARVFEDSYVVYYDVDLDWIPKDLAEIIEDDK
ncbi:hypothetical protein [Siminovitchia fordii]|uniref:Uncharacterized protein n=1 Tax=Siminovitchia fordii TaxID=254759 RepID=A0ABQ4KBJ0_9BACI|nr:hypothetical protein [Siminovitchia fordii]GIN22503.1 hypothetical protein J1TS3_36370 [Siminovitchia fordii]